MLDALKGYAAVAFAFWLASRQRLEGPIPTSVYDRTTGSMSSQTIFLLAALAAFVAILGHMFTVWLRFKGGKGVATAAGSFVALAPRAMLVVLVLFVLVVALTRYVSLGSMVAGAAFPLCVWWLGPGERTTRADSVADWRVISADHREAQRQHPASAGGHGEPVSMRVLSKS